MVYTWGISKRVIEDKLEIITFWWLNFYYVMFYSENILNYYAV